MGCKVKYVAVMLCISVLSCRSEDTRMPKPISSDLISSIIQTVPDSIKNKKGVRIEVDADSVLTIQYQRSDSLYEVLVFEHKYGKDNIRKREVYYQNFQEKSVEYFDSEGRRHGKVVEYYPSGCFKQEGGYKHGDYNGRWTTYYPSCQKEGSVTFLDNQPHGYDTIWYEDGVVQGIFEYRYGALVDTGFRFHQNSDLITIYTYDNNRLEDSSVVKKSVNFLPAQ